MTIFSVGVPSSPMCRSCSSRHSWRSRAATPIGIEALDDLQRALDLLDRPRAHGRNLLERRDEHAVVVQVADNRGADLAQLIVVGQQRELPQHVIGQR